MFFGCLSACHIPAAVEELHLGILARHGDRERVEESERGGKHRRCAVLVNHVAHGFFGGHGLRHAGLLERFDPRIAAQRLPAFRMGLVVAEVVLRPVVEEAEHQRIRRCWAQTPRLR